MKDTLKLNVTLNTKVLTRKLEVVKQGIELIGDGLNKIESGCPECGNDKVILDSIEFINDKATKAICSDCGIAYVIGTQGGIKSSQLI